MRPSATVQHHGPLQKPRAQPERADQVERAAHVDHIRHQADGKQCEGIKQDVNLGVVLAMGDRQHRDVGLGVFLLAMDRQRPEVRRGPGEDDQHQQQRFGADVTGGGGPAEQRRRGTGQTTDDDVLRGRALEESGVDHRVAEQRGEGQPRGQRVGERQQHGLPEDRQYQRERQRGGRRNPAFGERPFVGARHHRVDAPVHHMIDRRRATGTQGDAQVAENQHRPRHSGTGRKKHPHQRSDEHQHHDFGFGQFQVVTPDRLTGTFADQNRHGISPFIVMGPAECLRGLKCQRACLTRTRLVRAW
ncbi:hypothetical protein D3C86_1217400 [compost metagenome]